MKKIFLSLFIVLAVFFAFSGCSGNTSNVKLSAEMLEFVGMIKGKSADLVSALDKFGATQEIKDNDMGVYDLSDPKVIAKNGDCYSVEFTEGEKTRVYDICWTNGKITLITDKGMK